MILDSLIESTKLNQNATKKPKQQQQQQQQQQQHQKARLKATELSLQT
jgi:hypothetical protein